MCGTTNSRDHKSLHDHFYLFAYSDSFIQFPCNNSAVISLICLTIWVCRLVQLYSGSTEAIKKDWSLIPYSSNTEWKIENPMSMRDFCCLHRVLWVCIANTSYSFSLSACVTALCPLKYMQSWIVTRCTHDTRLAITCIQLHSIVPFALIYICWLDAKKAMSYSSAYIQQFDQQICVYKIVFFPFAKHIQNKSWMLLSEKYIL